MDGLDYPALWLRRDKLIYAQIHCQWCHKPIGRVLEGIVGRYKIDAGNPANDLAVCLHKGACDKSYVAKNGEFSGTLEMKWVLWQLMYQMYGAGDDELFQKDLRVYRHDIAEDMAALRHAQ